MQISLIVCTRNRAHALSRCLEAIARLDFDGAWEFVLVDNGSSDGTREIAERFATVSNFPVVVVREDRPGLSAARNAGLAASSGEIIAFTDDDCYVAPDFLDATVAAFADPDLGYVSGRIMLHDPTDFPATINESMRPVRFPAFSYVAPGAVKGANMAFRRCVLTEIGGFDCLFGSGSLFPAEDCDAAGRAAMCGWEGAYDPAIVVSHHHGRKRADIAPLHKSYAIGRGAYHAKLLGTRGAFGAGLRGWVGLPRRAADWPGNLVWEIAGALRYARASGGRDASIR